MQLLALIGKKSKQSQGFLQNGKRVPLTAVNVMGNMITQIKTTDKEGYSALQIGLDFKKKAGKRDLNKAKQAGLTKAPRFFKELKVDDTEGVALGSQLNPAEVFAPGDIVDVIGTSKGKGFAGGVKRHGFKGGPRTHGQSDRERAPGSIGQTTTPGRVYKGKKMAGRMGTDTVTVKNLEILEITADGVLLIRGLVPGFVNGVLTITKVGENKKFVPLYKEEVKEEATTEEIQPVEQQAAEENSEPTQAEQVKAQSEDAAEEVKSEDAVADPEVKEEIKEEGAKDATS